MITHTCTCSAHDEVPYYTSEWTMANHFMSSAAFQVQGRRFSQVKSWIELLASLPGHSDVEKTP